MHLSLTSIVVDSNPADRQEMVQFLMQHGVGVQAELGSMEPLAETLAGSDLAQLVVVNLDPQPRENLGRVAQLVRQHPGISFLVMSRVLDPDLLMDAVHSGVKEFVALPVDEDRFARGLARIADAHRGARRGRVLHVLPTAGGCGATTVACNLAVALARHGKTVLVDLDLARGTVATSFDIRPRFTIADLMDLSQRLDRQLLDSALAVHEPSGVAILGRPELPEDAHKVSAQGVERLLHCLGREFDYVVMDSLTIMDAISHAVVKAADVNLLVMQLNVPGVRNAQRFIQAMRRAAVDTQRLRLVANRFLKRGAPIELNEAERAMGLPVAWTVPNDYRTALDAANFGEPVLLRNPRSDMSTSLVNLAATLNGRVNH